MTQAGVPMRQHPGQHPDPRQQGYVLLFVLGLLAVVATVVLGASISLRLDTQLLAREKTRLQQQYALQGAAHEAVAQLGISRAVDALQLDPRDPLLRDWPLWRADGQEQRVTIGSILVSVQLRDVSGLPDANLLTESEWQRLLLAAGAASPERAQALASQLMALRQRLRAMRGANGGFNSLQELLQWPELPVAIAYGNSAKEQPGLDTLVQVGTGNKRFHIDSTPPLIFKALSPQLTQDQLQRLLNLRRAGPINAQQGQQWLQETGLNAYPPGTGTTAVQALLRVATPGTGQLEMLALIAGENTRLAVVDQWFDPGLPKR